MGRFLHSTWILALSALLLSVFHVSNAMSDNLCLYSATDNDDEATDSACPHIDTTSGFYLSWVGTIDRSEQKPALIQLEGEYKANRFFPSNTVLTFAPMPAANDTKVKSGNAEHQDTPEGQNHNLLSRMDWSLFSPEGRVRLQEKNGILSLTCHSGKEHAGVALIAPFGSFPQTTNSSLIISGRADGRFKLGFADKTNFVADDAKTFPVHSEKQSKTDDQSDFDLFELPSSEKNSSKIVIECPEEAAHFDIAAITIKTATSENSIATWVWHKQNWLHSPAGLLDWAQQYHINKLYVQVDIQDNVIVDEEQLVEFLGEAHKRSIDIYAVEGDADMIVGKGQDLAFQRTQSLAAFQKRLPENAKLAGLQFDIEPYTVPKYSEDPTRMWVNWAATLIKMHEIWGGPIDVIIPYWIQNSNDGKNALESIKDLGSFTVMIYRTKETEINAISARWLMWGEKFNTKISVALENGPVNGPAKLYFTPVKETNKQNYGSVFLVLARTANGGDKTVYQLGHIEQPDAAKISFLKRTEDLSGVVLRLSPYFKAFSSFNGLAIHGLL